MPTCNTRYFGETEYEEDSLILMARGPLGFESKRAFLLIQLPDQFPLVYLQSVTAPDLCFLALPVLAVDGTYRVELAREDAVALGAPIRPQIGRDVLCLALVTVQPDGPTANLLAPIVVNLATRAALQCINAGDSYSHQHRLTPVAEGVSS